MVVSRLEKYRKAKAAAENAAEDHAQAEGRRQAALERVEELLEVDNLKAALAVSKQLKHTAEEAGKKFDQEYAKVIKEYGADLGISTAEDS